MVDVKQLRMDALGQEFSICKVADYTQINLESPFVFTGSTDEEKSLVCPTELVPQNTVERDDGWKALRIIGMLDFSLVGILARISNILAENSIGIFAVSTFNTDYIFVKRFNFDKAIKALEDAGFIIGKD
ncbi:MAG: ACT domain-containing protein [Victivallales bacterium]|nr:ACT domain-containing protein [Victivallales bacterium]